MSPAQQDALRHSTEFDSIVSHTYTGNPLRHLREPHALPHIDNAKREALWHGYFSLHPEQRPLCAAATPTPVAEDLSALLHYYRQGIRQLLA